MLYEKKLYFLLNSNINKYIYFFNLYKVIYYRSKKL